MLTSSLCDYIDVYILVKGRIAINAVARQLDEINKGVIFKNCVPFINCKRKINNTEKDDAKDIEIVMPMYNVIKYSDNYLKQILKFMAIL